MKFYVCLDDSGQTFDCVMTKKQSREIVHNAGGGSVMVMDIPINATSIQRLLGNFGGYAKAVKSFEVK